MEKSVMFKVFSMSMFAMLFTLLFFIQPTANASNPTNVVVGAIRWDGFYGPQPPPAWTVGESTEATLGPSQFHFRLPFFGVETGANSVQARETTQTIMDQDIAYAKQAMINYWAFLYYPDGTGLDIARKLYDSSTHKSDVKYCYIVDQTDRMPASSFSYLVGKFGETNYQKVLGNRPLFYILGTAVYTASDITNLRTLTTNAGLGTPYIVVMDSDHNTASSSAGAIGADAISSYVTGTGGGGPYSGLVSEENTRWTNYQNTGKKVVPFVTTGWDPRPRIVTPNPWQSYYGANSWTATATPSEIANHLQEGLNWIGSHPTVADANAVIMYAWNEFDEGGWITPTKVVGSSAHDTSRVDAIRVVLSSTATPTPTPGTNLALNKTYSASSQWDANQAAAKAFDGSQSTNWQAGSGSTFAGQWLEVNFGALTTFNKAVINEYSDNRTSGYKIEYLDVNNFWQPAYTGTTIGSNKTVTFGPVSGSKARIYFTSGSYTPIIHEFELYNEGSSPGSTNYVLNPGFENDGVSTQTPVNWSSWGNNPEADSTESTNGPQHGGIYHLIHWLSTPYQVYTYQYATGLTNGSYTLSAWVKSSGGQTSSHMKVQDYGGVALTTNIPVTGFNGAWQQISIPNIAVTNGQVGFGFWSDAGASQWIFVDDVSLTKN